MSISRRTDNTSRRINDVVYVCDSNCPNSNREHSHTGVVEQRLADTQRETGGYRQQKNGKTNSRKVGASDGVVISSFSSQITPTKDLILSSRDETSAIKDTHGVLRIPEDLRKSQSPKRDAVSASINHGRKGAGEAMTEIASHETDLSNLVSRWSGDASKFQRITEIWYVNAYTLCNYMQSMHLYPAYMHMLHTYTLHVSLHGMRYISICVWTD